MLVNWERGEEAAEEERVKVAEKGRGKGLEKEKEANLVKVQAKVGVEEKA